MGRGTSKVSNTTKSSDIETIIQNRPVLDVKVKNQIEKEMKEITGYAEVTMHTHNTGAGFAESVNGKQKFLRVSVKVDQDATSKEQRKAERDAFAILEKYNKKYKFDYQVNKKKYKSDGTDFKIGYKSVYELFKK